MTLWLWTKELVLLFGAWFEEEEAGGANADSVFRTEARSGGSYPFEVIIISVRFL